MLTRETPLAAISSAAWDVMVVPLLAKETRSPNDFAWRTRRNMSGRRSGSPPLKMSMGRNGAMLSKKEIASVVESSVGSGFLEAEARQ
jgi:hypothetical protein